MNELTFSGKDIDKMNWVDCATEIRVQCFFASKLETLINKINWDNDKRDKELAEKKAEIEALEARCEAGEEVEKELKALRKSYNIADKHLSSAKENVAFLQMHAYNARAIIQACEERQEITSKPVKKKRAYQHRYLRAPLAETKRVLDNTNKRYYYQTALKDHGLGELFGKELLIKIAKNRGYLSNVSTIKRMADVLNLSQWQVKTRIKYGQFTWSQVLALGAAFEMTPAEFADTFLKGYFVEVADGVYRASAENIPDEIIDKSVLYED